MLKRIEIWAGSSKANLLAVEMALRVQLAIPIQGIEKKTWNLTQITLELILCGVPP